MAAEVDYKAEGVTAIRGAQERRYKDHDITCPKIAKRWTGFNYWSASCVARQMPGGSCHRYPCKNGRERTGRGK